jgi:hypothetical protein
MSTVSILTVTIYSDQFPQSSTLSLILITFLPFTETVVFQCDTGSIATILIEQGSSGDNASHLYSESPGLNIGGDRNNPDRDFSPFSSGPPDKCGGSPPNQVTNGFFHIPPKPLIINHATAVWSQGMRYRSGWGTILQTESRGFETWWDELDFSISLMLSAAQGPGFHSASNRNEYQKHTNNNVSWE